MLKYLIVILDDTSVSFCHYENNRSENRLMSLTDLKAGLLWAMKENLMVQVVYPSYNLPEEYYKTLDTIDHIDITPFTSSGDVRILNGSEQLSKIKNFLVNNIVIRLDKKELFQSFEDIIALVRDGKSCRVIIKDIINFDNTDFLKYKSILRKLSEAVEGIIESGNMIQMSLITDRIYLNSMNNCNAGAENITLAPDGKFYICPAFYYDELSDVGNPRDGLIIPNKQLLELEYAPICRNCDAFHCRRCIWLNQKTTLEVNTPSHEQCVVSHLERNESMRLLNSLKQKGAINTNISITEIDYLDPFDKIV